MAFEVCACQIKTHVLTEDKVMQSYINTYFNERIWTEYPVSTINNLNSFLSFTAWIEKKWIRMHLIWFWFLSFNSRQRH